MLRPIVLDLLDIVFPLAAALLALTAGRLLDRAPLWLHRTTISLAIAIVLLLGVSYFTPWRNEISDALWHIGGITTIACASALLLLGVVWSTPKRSTSTRFLATVATLIGIIIVLNTGGRLWWRTVSSTAWHNSPDKNGCLTQSSGWTCGPAAAAMLLHHHGIAASEGEMAYLAGTSYLGTDVPSIAWALTQKGGGKWMAHAVSADLDACRQRRAPFYASVHVPDLGGHAVLVLRVGADDVEWVDPRYGKRQVVKRGEVEPHWQGRIIFLERVE